MRVWSEVSSTVLLDLQKVTTTEEIGSGEVVFIIGSIRVQTALFTTLTDSSNCVKVSCKR